MSVTVAKGKSEAEAKTPARDAAVDGGKVGALKNWLPLIVTVVLMPVLAVATTNFLILPKIVHARGGEPGEAGAADGESIKKEGKGARGTAGKKRLNYQVSKVIVNVAGSMGSRYLMTSFTLVGSHADFKDVLDENKDQLLDLANTSLASKSISDLEKPGARNQIRAELISIFNNALGGGYVQDIFFTEFAIQ